MQSWNRLGNGAPEVRSLGVFVGLLLTAFGVISVVKTEWVAALERRRRTTMSKQHHSEIQLTEGWYALHRSCGILFGLFGLAILLVELT